MASETKVRTVPVRMSDGDLRDLAEKCGRSGISVQRLLEVFIGDLIGGSFYSGSDEGLLADQWFDRHGFTLTEDSLLSHLLRDGSVDSVDRFLTAWDERSEEWSEEEIRDALTGFDRTPGEEDIQSVREWLEEYRTLSE